MRIARFCVLLAAALPLLGPRPAVGDDETPPFVGRIVYTQKADGDADGAKTFNGLAASRVTAHIGSAGFRIDEDGGINAGSAIVREGSTTAIRLNHEKKTSERGVASDLDSLEDVVKQAMVWHYKTDLEETTETATICGHETRRYHVKRSAFVRRGATADVWIAANLTLPRRRFNFEFEWNRVISPIPLSIPADGAILKVEVLENGTRVTLTAVEVSRGEPDAALFSVPDGYEGPRFPKATSAGDGTPEAVAEPAPVVDLEGVAAKLENSFGMTLILVRPGTFTMGSPVNEPDRHDDETPHEVTLTRPYYVATTEVTQGQWRGVMGDDAPSKFKGNDLPVENVTWAQAVAFCDKLSEKEGRTYRLPTEAEWECAARAGESTDLAAMNMEARKSWLNARAWQYFNAEYKTHPVGTLEPNAWGLFDTIGNVGEWTSSGYGAYPAGPVSDPAGADSARKAIRGNGWISSYDFCRVASRDARAADEPKSTIGFRVVCNVTK